ncbi:GH25 family lysozyme M1 (1,4-beta-N-acetylmuramidase) [Chitinophaga skermanii]|uniref:GH25 family lysozyme M1 (1,4-beta-N-acetylmuramidase) n=1 Tax=Chitinophaga skermanii TaxID=331697 RepID=A0A327QKK0_9BACT|nr:GH25 family lysozyme [Chitinophaga skermanii]RAJ04234.1 GH25 family lysozyme M1 (1,4-beta-N-acetylmuramidase) [Chitinophaga skermanii]
MELKASHQVIIATFLVVKLCILLLYQYFKRKGNERSKEANKERLANVLLQCSHLCEQQYVQTLLICQQSTTGNAHHWEIPNFIYTAKGKLDAINTGALLKEYLGIYPHQHSARVTFTITDGINGLRFVNNELLTYWQEFYPNYESTLQVFYGNISNLLRAQDEVNQLQQKKAIPEELQPWIISLQQIFQQWQASNTGQDVMMLHKILAKIEVLNQSYLHYNIVQKYHERVKTSINLYEKIQLLEVVLLQKIKVYAWHFKKVGKQLAVISKSLYRFPTPATVLYVNMKPTKPSPAMSKERIILLAAVLLMAAAGFFGGRFSTLATMMVDVNKIANEEEEEIEIPIDLKTDTTARTPTKALLPQPNTLLQIIRKSSIINGIDISKYQGNLLTEINSLDSLHFVICKASQGAKGTDPYFAANWERLHKLPVIKGAYHFFNAAHDPIQQAKHFLQTVGSFDSLSIPPIVDVEEQGIPAALSPAEVQLSLLQFLRYVEKVTKRVPMIYTDLNVGNKYLKNEMFAEYPLWLAAYIQGAHPTLPLTWQKSGMHFWQKSSSFNIESTQADYDLFSGTGEDFIAFLQRY